MKDVFPRVCIISAHKRPELQERHQALSADYDEITKLLNSNANKASTSTERAELFRQKECLEQRLSPINFMLTHGVDGKTPEDARLALFGTVVTIQLYDENDNKLGRPVRYRIVGYEETNLAANIPELSYASPLLDGIYGKPVDSKRDPSPIAGTRRFVQLLKIELPPPEMKAVA